MRTLLFVAFVFVAGLVTLGQTSEDTHSLKRALERFPKADKNNDGVLTLSEAQTYLARNRNPMNAVSRGQNETIFAPSAKQIEEANTLGRQLAKGKEPVVYEKGKGLRVLMTGHSWVAPGRVALPRLAASAGFDAHRQRSHSSGGATGSANSIWLKEFGKWRDSEPANPVLIPAILTGEWDVLTMGGYYEDKPAYFRQWIDLCLERNPDMVFYIQDGWPRFNPDWVSLGPDEIRKRINARHAEIQAELVQTQYGALEKAYPGKVRYIPAGPAVVDLFRQYLDGKLENLDCLDETWQGGSSGILRDGGHLSRASGADHIVGYLYFGMLYRKSPATIVDYTPENVPAAFDKVLRETAWRAIVDSPFAGIDDDDGDGVAD